MEVAEELFSMWATKVILVTLLMLSRAKNVLITPLFHWTLFHLVAQKWNSLVQKYKTWRSSIRHFMQISCMFWELQQSYFNSFNLAKVCHNVWYWRSKWAAKCFLLEYWAQLCLQTDLHEGIIIKLIQEMLGKPRTWWKKNCCKFYSSRPTSALITCDQAEF